MRSELPRNTAQLSVTYFLYKLTKQRQMAAEAAYVVGNRRTRRRLCNIATQCNIIYSTEWWKPGELLVAPRNQQETKPPKTFF